MEGIEEGTLKRDSLWKMAEPVGTIAILGRGSRIVELLKYSSI